jgi:hypothetical protein
MTEDAVEWLVREVGDLLGVSSVGLYEFIWLLRSGQPEMTDNERRGIADLALRRLLCSEAMPMRLIQLTWTSHDPEGDVGLDAVPVSAWDDPPEGLPYVALARN